MVHFVIITPYTQRNREHKKKTKFSIDYQHQKKGTWFSVAQDKNVLNMFCFVVFLR